MKLCFDSIDEVKDFVKGLKGTRGGKGGDNDGEGAQAGGTGQVAPALLQPPQGGAAFNPGATSFAPQGGAAFGVPSPEIAALVTRVITRIDGLISSGQQPAEMVLNWFRGRSGPEAANATLDQIKQVFLPRAPVTELQEIAKLIAA